MSKRRSPSVDHQDNSSSPSKIPKLESSKVEEVIKSLENCSNMDDLGNFVFLIKQQLKAQNRIASRKGDKHSTSPPREDADWKRITDSGDKLLKWVSHVAENIEVKAHILFFEYSTIAADMLKELDKLCPVGGLAIVAYVIKSFNQIDSNKEEAFVLLSSMVDLATTVIEFKKDAETTPEIEEKCNKAITLLVRGSILCISQIKKHIWSSFLKTKVDAKKLRRTSKMLHQLYRDLEFSVTVRILNLQRKNQSKLEDSLSKIEKRLSEIEKGVSENPKSRAGEETNMTAENNMQRSNLTPSPKTPGK